MRIHLSSHATALSTPMPFSALALKGALLPLHVLEPDARVQNIPEAVVQDIWASREFESADLRTTAGDAISIIDPGRINHDGGPDFTGARLRIESPETPGGTLNWTGDIEIHRNSGEWLLHRHHEDPKYNRVVLHVVLLEDSQTGTLRRADGTRLPEIVLYPRLTTSLRSLLHRFYTQEQKDFYCEASWAHVPEPLRDQWLNRLGLARLRMRAAAWAQESPELDLDELVYRGVLRALGYAKNADAMSDLARRLPLKLLRAQSTAQDVEALLFGVSGLLPELSAMLHTDRHSVEYVVDLRDRFERLGQTMEMRPMNLVTWQYFRLRPANFPTLRIAQAAALLAPAKRDTAGGLLSSQTMPSLREAIGSDTPKKTLRSLLQAAEPSDFWREHVRFEQRSPGGSSHIGISRTDQILMDAVLPLLLLDAELRKDRQQENQVCEVMQDLPAVSDEVTRMFEKHGAIPGGALGSQGLHQLFRSWCSEGRCLSCAIGRHVLSADSETMK